ncbi:MAG TPA: hypothetical protein VN494_00790 [Patescibacteria group bacterium]|nr:hypothetical protein [Patescibacteria group bacterium]
MTDPTIICPKRKGEIRLTESPAAALKDKLGAQKALKSLEADRNRKRRELFDVQDAIDAQRDVRAPVIEKQDIRKMLFSGFKKYLYRVQKFDSDSERRFAVVLENDPEVLKWFKPAKGDFQIHYANDASYEPDFVVETKKEKCLCEPKSAVEMEDREVLAKAKAAAEWCGHATKHERRNGGKPWTYLLIPHDVITDNKTLQGLAASYSYRG